MFIKRRGLCWVQSSKLKFLNQLEYPQAEYRRGLQVWVSSQKTYLGWQSPPFVFVDLDPQPPDVQLLETRMEHWRTIAGRVWLAKRLHLFMGPQSSAGHLSWGQSHKDISWREKGTGHNVKYQIDLKVIKITKSKIN